MKLKCSSKNDLYIAGFTELTFTEANMVEYLIQVGGKTPDITKRPSIREFYFNQGEFGSYGDFADSVAEIKDDSEKLARFIDKHGKN